MKFFRYLFLLSFLISAISIVNAQNIKVNQVVVIKGEKFVLHQVRTGETIFSISRDYKIDRSVLLENNPKIAEGLNIGDILKIPYREDVVISGAPIYKKGDPTRFESYKITSRRATPYFIAKENGITVEELYAYNPTVKKFKKNKTVRIPVWEEVKEKTDAENQLKETANEMIEHTVVSGETVYSISKRYGISESEILFNNPSAKSLKAGSKLYIPKAVTEISETPDEPEVNATKNYFEHIIESGETLWGTSRKYKVSEEELKQLNPVLHSSFQAGVVIKIPVKTEVETTQAKPVNDDAFIKHHVERGETLYGLGDKYHLYIDQIKKYNPVLESRNLVAGETILIPKKREIIRARQEEESIADSIQMAESFYEVRVPVKIPESCKPDESGTYLNDVYEIALFLPLYLEANDTLNREYELQELADSLAALEVDTKKLNEIIVEISQDTTIEKEEGKEIFKRFYSNSESLVQFYEGVLLAIDSMQNLGMQIKLNVYDTERNGDSIREIISKPEFLETDLIIGPVYQDVQIEVAQIAAKNRIPIISPLMSESNIVASNPSFYQLIPSRDYIAEKTAEMVGEEFYDSNFIILKMGDYTRTKEGNFVQLLKEKLFNSGYLTNQDGVRFTEYDLKAEGPFGLRSIMSKHKENVVYIPAKSEGDISVAVSNLNNLSDDFAITLIGSNRFTNFKSINVEQYHNLKLRYIAPYWLDYKNQFVINIIEMFKANFGTEPSSTGVQGFDAAYFFLNAFKAYGKEFETCLPFLHVDLLQGTYHFEKVSQFGGYMNQGVSVISYGRNYKVYRNRIKGQPLIIAEN